jgi:hypothetical protein
LTVKFKYSKSSVENTSEASKPSKISFQAKRFHTSTSTASGRQVGMPKSKKETTMVKDDIRYLEDLTKLLLKTIVATKTPRKEYGFWLETHYTKGWNPSAKKNTVLLSASHGVPVVQKYALTLQKSLYALLYNILNILISKILK